MFAITLLSIVLYGRCFRLLISLNRTRRALLVRSKAPSVDRAEIIQSSEDLQEGFRQQRVALGAMIAAAPLLGLLGTVSGMARTFQSISAQTNGKSMEGLARGISEVLVATESGLLVALPALGLVYLAHREVAKTARELNRSLRTSFDLPSL